MPKKASAKPTPPRKRRDAEAARGAILDAAERRLVEGGPSGMRLQEVAAEAGVSHPTILHHFGSREGLVKAVIARTLDTMHENLISAIAASTGEEDQLLRMLDGVYEMLSKGGHGRVLMWLALEGHAIFDTRVRLEDVVTATHSVRQTKLKEKRGARVGREPTQEDTAFTVVLGALALAGASVLGPALFENAGLVGAQTEGDPKRAGGTRGATQASLTRFRSWLAHLLMTHLDTDDASAERPL